jgi:hypothetical protein
VPCEPEWRQTWGVGSLGFRRGLRRYRPWWPLGLAGAGALIVALVEAGRTSDDQGIAGPLLTVCVIAGLAGLVTGVTDGLVQESPRIELRIRLALVVVALATAMILGGGPIVAGLSALTGSGVALGSEWLGRRIMLALMGRDDEDGGSESR